MRSKLLESLTQPPREEVVAEGAGEETVSFPSALFTRTRNSSCELVGPQYCPMNRLLNCKSRNFLIFQELDQEFDDDDDDDRS